METAVDRLLKSLLHLTENDRSLLARVSQGLPLLADIARADVLLYVTGTDPDTAVVAADAKPHTVPPIYADAMAGRKASRDDEPTVIRAMSRGRPVQRVNRVLVHGHPTVQDVYPICNEGSVIGALSVEVGLLEAARQRRKSPVFRRAVQQLKLMVLRGQLEGTRNITPLGEHDGPLVVDDKGQIVYISSIAENLYRKLEYTHSLLRANLANLRTDEGVYFKAMETGACVEQTVEEGPLVWVKKAVPLVGHHPDSWLSRLSQRNDEMDGVMIVIHDITDERRKEQELKIKSAMIKEIHHRVKNNLQTIAALLRLQARRTGSPEITEMLKETTNRILSIAVVHEFLAHDESSIVNIREVSQRIITEVARSILDPEKHVRFSLEGDDIYLPTQQATSCALIINELLQNAVEHGYASRSEGQVVVRLQSDGDQHRVEIVDDGVGLAADFGRNQETSLGLQIVQTLVREDLKGRFELVNANGNGARALVSFPRHIRAASAAAVRS